jgi:CRP-like cAMP-binding protein
MSRRQNSSETATGPEAEMNRLLAILPVVDSVRPLLERVTYATGETIYEAGAPLTHYVFPRCGIVSSVHEVPQGAVEVGTAGAEGMVGIAALLGERRNTHHTFAQSLVIADRIEVEALDARLAPSLDSRAVLFRYVNTVHHETLQYAVCNRLHSVEERLARWLLLSHDRHGTDLMPITQLFLSNMLGVYRPRVSLAAAILRKAGLIRYTRGHLEVRDRPGLESVACECYAIARALFHDAGLPWGRQPEG